MTKFETTGDVVIGIARTSNCPSKLFVDKDKIEISPWMWDNLYFYKEDIISIELFKKWYIGKGIRINHNKQFYDTRIIFLPKIDPKYLLEILNQFGFY